mmetsp:Transcript_25970/g.70250  ORF Transcript_25970/g.70250 Transcript_25970/m.70250 type:complete len:664 (+) Transcript_25970:161-2152(+)
MAGERALAIFKEDLEGPIEVAKAAAQRLAVVAIVVGKHGTKTDLLPYVAGKVKDPDTPDEILFRLAEQLDIAKLMDGFDPVLVAPLEALCMTEETIVRDAACKTVNSLIAQTAPKIVKEHVAPMLLRLCGEGNWFTARVSACRIFGPVYHAVEKAPDSDELLRQLREVLTKLGADESPMVKRGAASAIGEVADKVTGKAAIAEELRALVRVLCLGPSSGLHEGDPIRILAVGSLPSFAKFSSDSSEGCQVAHEIAAALARDKSWKLRVAIATHLGAVAQAVVGGAGSGLDFISICDQLQRDPEPEVRFVMAQKAVSVAQASSPAAVGGVLVPNLLALVTDSMYRTPQDRAQLAGVLVDLVEHCDANSEAVGRVVGEVSALLASSEESQFVRIQLIESTPKLVAVTGASSPAAKDLMGKVLKFFDLSSQDGGAKAVALAGDMPASGANPVWCWRLRHVASETVGAPELVPLGTDFYREFLAPIVQAALLDQCTLVRVSAITGMATWAARYENAGATPGQWADENVVPALLALRQASETKHPNKSSYALRLTLVYGLECSAGYLSPNGLAQLVSSVADKDVQQEVPNVRVAIARCFARLHQSLDFKGSPAEQMVSGALHKLSGDADMDVKELANAGLAKERLPLTFPHWGPTGAPWCTARVGAAP